MLYMKNDGEISEFDGSEVLIFPLTTEELKFFKEDISGFEKYINLEYDGEDIKEIECVLDYKLKMQEKDPQNWVYNTSWLIVSLLNKNIIGTIDFKGCPNENGEVEIGYGIGKRYQNRGYATSAVELMCKYAKDNGIKCVKANCYRSNIASRRVLEKNNFKKIKEDDKIFYFERKF